MTATIDVRLTVVGTEDAVSAFERSKWHRALRAKHIEIYETSDCRLVWWYQTEVLSANGLTRISSEWEDLTFLVEYEDHTRRVKGLLKAVTGKVDHAQFAY